MLMCMLVHTPMHFLVHFTGITVDIQVHSICCQCPVRQGAASAPCQCRGTLPTVYVAMGFCCSHVLLSFEPASGCQCACQRSCGLSSQPCGCP